MELEKKKCGLRLERLCLGSLALIEQRVEMVWVHPNMAISIAASMLEKTSARLCLQLGKYAFAANGTCLSFPLRQQLVFDEDMDDLLVGGLDEFGPCAFPLDLVLALSTGVNGDWVPSVRHPFPRLAPSRSTTFLDHSRLAFLGKDGVEYTLHHDAERMGQVYRLQL